MSFDQHNANQLPPLAPAPAKTGNWFARHKIISGGIGVFIGLAVIGSFMDSAPEKQVVAQAANAAPAPSARTVDQAAIDKAVAEALAKQAAAAAPAPAVSAEPTTEPSTAPEPSPKPTPSQEPAAEGPTVNFAMPNFVGMNLQDAQDKVQTYGVFYSISHDLNGSRMQFLDSNWKVCDQNIKPGTKIKGAADKYEGEFDFGTVKIAEDCP